MEQFAVLCYAIVAGGGYTAGSHALNVDSTSTGDGIFSFPTVADFTVSICDPTTRAPKAVLKVTGVNSSTQWAVTASIQPDGQSADVNCSAGDLVIGTLDGRSLAALGSDTSWTALSGLYQNSWVDFGSGYQAGQYMRDRTGRVWLRGLIKGGTETAGTLLFTLPSGFRPPTLIECFAVAFGSGQQNVAFDIATSGTVTLVVTITVGAASAIDLNQIHFSVN